ncbi:MAG TPA: PIN domain-containing protein [Blastocatellia bacterium]|nr:PIN domain-containing protein [Blastocatellia bacterium]
MIKRVVILDTGALVAILRRRDERHQWANAKINEIIAPMLTCEAVLSEAHFLLQDSPLARQAIIEMSLNGIFMAVFNFEEEKASVSRLLDKYADVPMSFADACLVRMSEIYPDSAVFTTDSDFKIYRRNGRQQIPLIFPK